MLRAKFIGNIRDFIKSIWNITGNTIPAALSTSLASLFTLKAHNYFSQGLDPQGELTFHKLTFKVPSWIIL